MFSSQLKKKKKKKKKKALSPPKEKGKVISSYTPLISFLLDFSFNTCINWNITCSYWSFH